MTSLESIEKLRERLHDCTFDTYWITARACDILIDEIEREISERFIELPVDADGVPIRVGDVVELGENRNQGIVKALNEHMVIAMHVDCDYMNYAKYGLLWNADECRHVKPRTVEDVLRDFLDEKVYTSKTYERYADELRGLMGGGR